MHACVAKDFAQWRVAARPLIAARIEPTDVVWSDWRRPSLFGVPSRDAGRSAAGASDSVHVGDAEVNAAVPKRGAGTNCAAPTVPRDLIALLEELALFRDASRWDLMYRLTWRVLYENRSLLENDADPDVQTARQWSKAVHRDVHKMHAFVRFHETESLEGSKRYVAWFEPEHEILHHVAPFFEQRFPNMHWMIATPDGAAMWTGAHTEFVDSPSRADLPREDATHGLWRAYYRNICNVARINPKVMQREMPQRYWKHLPEATELEHLLRDGKEIHQRNLHSPAVDEVMRIPRAVTRSLGQIALPAESLQACRQCPLWQHATQAVAGEGPEHAAIMLVGEQPGDEEDLKGHPFIGPAGKVLDNVLREVELDRSELYVTNAVKHFKWEPRGKRRLHKRPNQQEVQACGSWLESEIATVAPRVIVALGATAIRAVTGLTFNVEDSRHSPLRHSRGAAVIGTYHPSAILRAEDARRDSLLAALRDDLRRARQTSTDVGA